MKLPVLPWMFVLLWAPMLHAQDFSLDVEAPAHASQPVLVYRYLDLITLRQERAITDVLDAQGRVHLTASVTGTQKIRLRIGDTHADLYVRPGSVLRIRYGAPEAGTPRSMSGTTQASIELLDLPPLGHQRPDQRCERKAR